MAGEFNATQGAQLLTTYIVKKWIPALERDLQISKFTTKVVIPPGMGKVGRAVTFSSPPGTTTAITDGTLGNNVDITTTGTNVTITELGEYMALHRIQEYASAPSLRDEIVNRFTHGGLVSIDGTVNVVAQANTTNVFMTNQYSGSGVILGTPSGGMNAAAIIAARKKVKDSFATGFYGIEGHIDGQYAAVIGQQAELDMVTEATTGRMTWTQAVTNVPGRMGQEKWVNGYIGSIYGTAVYTSQNLTTGLTISTANVTCNFVLGNGALAAMSFKDMEPDVFINSPGPNSTDNPYRNFSSVAWHAYFGAKMHDATRFVKLYSVGS